MRPPEFYAEVNDDDEACIAENAFVKAAFLQEFGLSFSLDWPQIYT